MLERIVSTLPVALIKSYERENPEFRDKTLQTMIVKSREASSFPVFFPWRYRFCVRGDEVSTFRHYVFTDDAAGVIESAVVS